MKQGRKNAVHWILRITRTPREGGVPAWIAKITIDKNFLLLLSLRDSSKD